MFQFLRLPLEDIVGLTYGQDEIIVGSTSKQDEETVGFMKMMARFESVGLSGHFIPTERGENNEGLNVILLSSKVMLGGGAVRPLKASRPVQVLIASLLLDPIVADGSSGKF
ncbi:hypothetical protein ACFE04_023934 [Oxalis oulophora]